MFIVPDYILDEKEKLRKEIEQLTKEFEENGGEITTVEAKESNHKFLKPVNEYGKNTAKFSDY